MKYFLYIALAISVIWNIVAFKMSRTYERSSNRPIIDSFIIAGSSDFPDRKSYEVDSLVRLLLLDFLNSGFYQPLNSEIRNRCVNRLISLAEPKEIAAKLSEIFLDVTNIELEHSAIFISDGKTRFVVLGGTRYVTSSSKGSDSRQIIDNITRDFFRHIGVK